MSKRYQAKRIPECPNCGETKYIEIIGVGYFLFGYICDICDRGFEWYESEPKPTNAEIEYKSLYRMIRMHHGMHRSKTHRFDYILPMSIKTCPYWVNAWESYENRYEDDRLANYKKYAMAYGLIRHGSSSVIHQIRRMMTMGRISGEVFNKYWLSEKRKSAIPF